MYSAGGLTQAFSRLETRGRDGGKTQGVGVRPRGDLVGGGGNGAGWGRLFDELDEDKDGRVSFADLADAVNPCLSTLAERPQTSIPERRAQGTLLKRIVQKHLADPERSNCILQRGSLLCSFINVIFSLLRGKPKHRFHGNNSG